MDSIIEVKDLSKYYGSFAAVKNISFEVKRGSLFAFLGVNGAGKSTSIEMLCTLLEKSGGDIYINGYRLGTTKMNDAIRQEIGVVFQNSILDNRLTVKENIMSRARLYPMTKKEIEENWTFLDGYLNLKEIEAKRYGMLSGGQRRRVDIARAIIHRPNILFLDEPTTGLDPQTRVFVWHALKKLQEQTNMTIFLTTHYMEEAAVADEIVVMKQGEIVSRGTPQQLKARYTFDVLDVYFNDEQLGLEQLQAGEHQYTVKNGQYQVKVSSTIHALQLLKQWEDNISSFEVKKGSMDDVFIRINEEVVVNEYSLESC